MLTVNMLIVSMLIVSILIVSILIVSMLIVSMLIVSMLTVSMLIVSMLIVNMLIVVAPTISQSSEASNFNFWCSETVNHYWKQCLTEAQVFQHFSLTNGSTCGASTLSLMTL